jgi:hypothetical protein
MAEVGKSDKERADDRAEVQSIGRGDDPIPPMRADRHSSSDPAVETPIEARQGFLGRPFWSSSLPDLRWPLEQEFL